MTKRNGRRSPITLALVILGLLACTAPLRAATITIVNNDGVNEGFNDPTPRAPVGGNPGTTIGAQRLFVFQHAAAIWGSILPSTVQIVVGSTFDPLTCDATSAVLGQAGPTTIHRDFAGAPIAGHWYHQALANKLAGTDLAPANADISAVFNTTLDGGTCLGGLVWYYGVDGNEGSNVELLPVVIHELGHGLGFSTTTNASSGAFTSGFPGIWDRFLLDNPTGLHWDQLSQAQRQSSAISTNLVWDGVNVTSGAASFLSHRPRMTVNAPAPIAGVYSAVGAAFGAALTVPGVTAGVTLVTDAGGANPNDACQAITNAGAIAGKIALIDRGNCNFTPKAAAAQAAGAVAVIIVNNAAGLPPDPMAGSDPTITIPVIGISQADGNTLKANLATANVTVGGHPTLLSGADNTGKPFMFAPSVFSPGSTVSHWDISLSPNALMEPFINSDLHDQVDLTRNLFRDLGWNPATPVALALFTAEGRMDGIFLRWFFSDASDIGALTLERAERAEGPWSPIETSLGIEREYTTALDTSAEPDHIYWYRLMVLDRAGHSVPYGLTSARRPGPELYLSAATPNPTTSASSVTFRIGTPEYVRLSVTDVSGRRIRTLQDGMLAPGEYIRTWDGRSDRDSRVGPGIYFLTLDASSEVATRRVAIIR